jgi:hypothetical protein
MFLNSLGNIFASWETNFVSTTMLPRVGKVANKETFEETFEETSRITNVFTTMFPSLPRALEKCRCVQLLYLKSAGL